MSQALLRTKLYVPPLRPSRVFRQRLVEQLNQGLELGHKLTLISAPAGFGKTTFLSEWADSWRTDGGWASRTTNRVAWLSVDDGDNDPIRFLTYFVAAICQVDGANPAVGEPAMRMLESPQPPSAESVITSLINDVVGTTDKIVVVLDDYHILDSQPVDSSLAFLLEHLPPQLHLVIATRDDPNLPLARYRASGHLTELRAADLRFTVSEATEFLNQVMGLDLSAADIAALETRTEGWITGLQLAALSMQGHQDTASFIKSFTGSHHFVLDYLVEEVLEQQSKSTRTFLLQTAVLNRLNGPLCDALTGRDNGQETLEKLSAANLFIIPLDAQRAWYRYHHLFADLLRQRLRQTKSDGRIVLHRRASAWFEQNGLVEEAIEHALRARDFDRTAQLIEEHFDAFYQRGEHNKLRRWLAGLPEALLSSKPGLWVLHAWYLFRSGQLDQAERTLQTVEIPVESAAGSTMRHPRSGQEWLSAADGRKFQGMVTAIRAFLAYYRGDGSGAVDYARQALDELPAQELTWGSAAAVALGDGYEVKGDLASAYRARVNALERSKATGDSYLCILANLKVAVTLRSQGQLSRVIEICRQQMAYAADCGMTQAAVSGWLLAIWAEALAERNQLDEAIAMAEEGVALADRSRDVVMLGRSSLCLLRVLFSIGDLAAAEAAIWKLQKIARHQDVPPWITCPMAAWQARIWLAQGKLESAVQWAEQRQLAVASGSASLHQPEEMAIARVRFAQGWLDDAVERYNCLLAAAQLAGHMSRMIEILILLAIAIQSKGESEKAMAPLERALKLARTRGFARIFLDEGPPVARLLIEAASLGIESETARRLLAVFPAGQSNRLGSLGAGPADGCKLVEPLSDRELEVLNLIAQGMTNPEIAAALFLSLNTIKAHARNISGKLGTHNRTQAVARARALGILLPT